MPKRDPFGRLPDENPLAGLGTLSEGTESQIAEPVVAGDTAPWTEARSAKAKPARPQPSVDPALAEAIRRAESLSTVDAVKVVRSVGRVVKAVFVVAVIAIVAGVGSTVFETGKSVRDKISELPSPQQAIEDATDSGGAGKRVAPQGLNASSLLQKGNVARSMRRLRASGLGRMRSMTIRPERIDAQLLTTGGRVRSVQLPWDGELDDFGASGGGFAHLDTIPYATIDSGAPGRLARAAAERSRKPVTQVDYVVLISFAGKPLWSAFMKNGKQFLADRHGRITSKVS